MTFKKSFTYLPESTNKSVLVSSGSVVSILHKAMDSIQSVKERNTKALVTKISFIFERRFETASKNQY